MRGLTFLLILLVFSSAGYIFEESFARLKALVVPLLVVIMLSMGLTLRGRDFKEVFLDSKIVLYGALLQFTVMPLLGFAVAKLLGLERELLTGFVLVGSAPGGTASNLITYISGGDLAYSVSMTTLSTLLSPLLTPLWTWLLAGKYVPVPFLDMALTTLKIVILPVLIGMLLRRVLLKQIAKVEAFLPYLSILAIAFIIAVIFALNKQRVEDINAALLAGVMIHNLGGFLLGFLLGKATGLDNRRAKTLSIEVGMQNSGLSMVLALKFFSPLSALPSAVFSLTQNLLGVLLSFLFRRLG